MSLPEQLSAMVFELKGAGSPVAKAKALARAWRFVRRLDPGDRKVLAREAGFDGAEDLLETLATKKGGIAPAMLLQLLGGLKGRNEEHLGAVIGALEDPQRREAMLLGGVDALAESLLPEAPEPEDDVESEEIPILVQDAVSEAPAISEDFLESDAGTPSEPEPQRAEPTTGIQVKTVTEDPTPIELFSEEPKVELPTQVTEVPISGTEIPVTADSWPDPEDLLGILESERSLVARLLTLRDAIEELQNWSQEDLRRLVGVFPEGWPQRRAVGALLDGGIPEKTADALELIEILERPVDRRWSLGLLLDRRGLQPPDAERALEIVESSALHRRIVRRSRSPVRRSG